MIYISNMTHYRNNSTINNHIFFLIRLKVAPQDIGIISGLTEYPSENMNQPQSHSIIRLKKVTIEMTGDYTCSVSTFSEDVTAAKHMTVYGKIVRGMNG